MTEQWLAAPLALRCPEHPTYTAQRRPRVQCPSCIGLYNIREQDWQFGYAEVGYLVRERMDEWAGVLAKAEADA